MAKKSNKIIALAPLKKIPKTFSEGEVGVLMESLTDSIKLIAEGHLDLDRKIDNLGKDLGSRIDSLDGRMDSLDGRMDSLDGRMDSLEQKVDGGFHEMRSSFKTIFEHLSNIDDELKDIKSKLENKANKQELGELEQRVARIEFDLNECKKIITLAKKS